MHARRCVRFARMTRKCSSSLHHHLIGRRYHCVSACSADGLKPVIIDVRDNVHTPPLAAWRSSFLGGREATAIANLRRLAYSCLALAAKGCNQVQPWRICYHEHCE